MKKPKPRHRTWFAIHLVAACVFFVLLIIRLAVQPSAPWAILECIGVFWNVERAVMRFEKWRL